MTENYAECNGCGRKRLEDGLDDLGYCPRCEPATLADYLGGSDQ